MVGTRNSYKRWIAIGFAALVISRGLEAMGDAAPFAASGVSSERLVFHIAALVLLVGAGAAFVRALVGAVRTIGGKTAAPVASLRETTRVFAETPARDAEFDPDAAFARYMEKKAAGLVTPIGDKPVRRRRAASAVRAADRRRSVPYCRCSTSSTAPW